MATIASAATKFASFFDDGDPDEIFVLEEEIASGSFGAVYKGRHYQDGQHYAVKIITPEEDEVLDDFMVEISILRRCKHEHIVGFNGAWVKGEELFIAMELCEGGAITDVFGLCEDPLTEQQIRLITQESMLGLQYMHDNSMIHRDLKGANILLTKAGDVKLVDFGVSAELRSASEKRFTLIGTPYWMAPEVIANKTGREAYGYPSDMWSLGITLIELAEMNPPLHEIHPMKALMMIPMREPPALAQPEKWSPEFKDFLAKTLQKSPDKRPTVAEALQHPFCQNLPPRQCLLDLIKKRDDLEAEEDDIYSDSGEDSPSDSEMAPPPDLAPLVLDDLPPPPVGVDATAVALATSAPPPPAVTPGADGASAWVATSPTPKSGASTPKKSGSGTPLNQSGSGLGNSGGSTGSGGAAGAAAAGAAAAAAAAAAAPETPDDARAKAHEQAARRKTARRMEQSETANRPTYRTNKKLTQRQIKERERELVSRQVVKDHMKVSRAQKSKHDKEEERVKRQQKRDHEALEKKLGDAAEGRQRELARIRERNERSLESDRASHQRAMEGEDARLTKDLDARLKKMDRQADSEGKNDHKQHTKERKAAEKVHKDETKAMVKERKLAKKEAKALEASRQESFEDQTAWADLRFQQQRAMDKASSMYEQRQHLREENERSATAALQAGQAQLLEQLKARQKDDCDAHIRLAQAQTEIIDSVHPAEKAALEAWHKLEEQHLEEQMATELDQQRELLASEFTQQKKANRAEQTKIMAEAQAKMKALQREIKNRRELKVKVAGMKDELKAKFKTMDDALKDKQDKQRADETKMIETHHTSKREQMKERHAQEVKDMADRHAAEREKAAAAQTAAFEEQRQRWRQEILDFTSACNKERVDLLSQYQREQGEDLQAFQAGEKSMLDAHQEAQLDLRKRQKTVGPDVMAALQQQQAEDQENTKAKHDNSTDVHKRTSAVGVTDLTQQLEGEAKRLAAEPLDTLLAHLASDKKGTLLP